jgi:hypothetical protein
VGPARGEGCSGIPRGEEDTCVSCDSELAVGKLRGEVAGGKVSHACDSPRNDRIIREEVGPAVEVASGTGVSR